jgi:hypothetical protein
VFVSLQISRPKPALDRETVIKLLKRKGGKMDSRRLVRKLGMSKRAEDVAVLTEILRAVAVMEEIPPGSGKKYLVLKQEFV